MQRVHRMVPQAAVGFFRRRLSAAGTPERATTEKAYLKSDLRFYGATNADVHRAAADFAREHPDLDRADLRGIAEACYATGVSRTPVRGHRAPAPAADAAQPTRPDAQHRTLGLAPWRDGSGVPYARGRGTRVGPRSAGR
jgi:predicted exporter